MYLQKVEIENIKAISHFIMTFNLETAPGWHVLIGDNGSGKTSIIRAISLGLIGQNEAIALRDNWDNWLKKDIEKGFVDLFVYLKEKNTENENGVLSDVDAYNCKRFTNFSRVYDPTDVKNGKFAFSLPEKVQIFALQSMNWDDTGIFSVAFGPYRRFAGGNSQWDKVYSSYPKLGAHLTAFGEDVALTEISVWLKDLKLKISEGNQDASKMIDFIFGLTNAADFLPNKTTLSEIGSNGVFFTDGNNSRVAIDELSDGYRSILSLTFELIRQLERFYSPKVFFQNVDNDNFIIKLPGIVLIDEVDAHLHPTWQTRIGQWFLKYFPKIQFIVTTHSPLVCRACNKGSIWRLAGPYSNFESGEITGTEKDRLVFGNVLDAYGTEVFGENVSISEEGAKMTQELAKLNMKSIHGTITEQEKTRFNKLKSILPT